MRRTCRDCSRSLTQDSYSKNQFSKGEGSSRCQNCVHGCGGRGFDESQRQQTARENDATSTSFEAWDLDNPFSQGQFRWVAKGRYTEGRRQGEQCVCKWFKSGSVFEKEFFELDIHAVQKAEQIIKQWNFAGFVNRVIRLNIPQVWTFTDGFRKGQKVLQEPFIENWQKFNSNSGWADDDTPWPRVMQALSHFSYHISSGQHVLCDLQGGVYSDGVVLTDPVILSRNKEFGVTDLGPEGISSFFSRHTCNEFCKAQWSKPRDAVPYFPAQMGTSMVATQNSRPVMTRR
eukprot:1531860-Rhodomonas_salina.3